MRADLEFFPDFYILMSTLAGGLPSVLRFMLGCTPLYFGFATVGTILFGVVVAVILTVLALFVGSLFAERSLRRGLEDRGVC
eukprot:COSAG06_NODE_27409_length_593_cov_58.036437_1_plen_81_part_10